MRSTFTNKLIKKIFSETHNVALVLNEDTGVYDEWCNGFGELANHLDALDEVQVRVINKYTDKDKGWFYFIMENNDFEQLSDYSANDWADKIVQSISNGEQS